MRRRKTFNPKRRIQSDCDAAVREKLVVEVRYGGNPEHKRNPRDFGLTPPLRPRPDKTLCDDVAVTTRSQALGLLRQGVKKGLVSEQMRGAYPQNIWAVTDEGQPLEAQLENAELGTYHGYPMSESDPFRDQVLDLWRATS